MIWFRRFLTVPLILIFIASLVAAVVVTAVNNTAANPKFCSAQMSEADVYNYVYSDIIPAALDEVENDEASDLPIDVADYKNEIAAAAEQAFPTWWLQQQFEAATSTLIPYVVDDKAGFTYTVVLRDRVEEAGEAIKANVLHSSAFPRLYNELIPYVADKAYEELGGVSAEAGVTKQEIEDALLSSVTQAWLITQVEKAIDAVAPYMTGESNSFSVNVPVQDVLNDSVLLKMLGPGNAKYLADAKRLIAGGLTFTDADLRAEMDDDTEKDFDKVRGWIINGYTVTQDDLREAMADDPESLGTFDDVRHGISAVRNWLWAAWVVSFLILIGIGFLGGRGWKTRAAGPLVILLVVSLVIFFAAMLSWSQYGEREMTKAFDEELANQTEVIDRLVLEKADELAVNAAGGVVQNIQNMGLYMAIASGVGLAGVGVWWMLGSRGKKGGSSKPSNPRGQKGAVPEA